MLTRVFDPVTIDPSITDLDGYLEKLQEELVEQKANLSVKSNIDSPRGSAGRRNRPIDAHHIGASGYRGALTSAEDDATANAIREQLAQAKQQMTAELQALLKDYQRAEDDQTIGGIPVDSEYVIFIIDVREHV